MQRQCRCSRQDGCLGKAAGGEPEFVLGPTDRAGAGGPQGQLVLVPPGKPAPGTAAALPGQLLAEQQVAGVHIRGTVSKALPGLGAHGVGPQILGAVLKARSLFKDVCPGQEQRTPSCALPHSPKPFSHQGERPRGATWVCTWRRWARPGGEAAGWSSAPSPHSGTSAHRQSPNIPSAPPRLHLPPPRPTFLTMTVFPTLGN